MQKRKLKICLICDVQSIHFKRWIRDLKDLGHDVSVISPYPDESGSIDVALVSTPKAPFPMFQFIKTFLKMVYRIWLSLNMRGKIKEISPDVLHSHFLTTSGWIGAWTGFHPFIVTIHGSDILVQPKESLIYRLGNWCVLKKADRIVGVAEHLKDHLTKSIAIQKKYNYIPNYVDPEFIIQKSRIASKQRDILVQPVIISARALDPIYDINTLIKSIPNLLEAFPDSKIMIIGDGEKAASLKQMAVDLGVADHIEFIGKVLHSDLIKYFQLGHIYVSTALSDGLSVTTLEGMASGLFPILTDIPANRSVVTDKKNGLLFPKGNSQRLTECIIHAINNQSALSHVCEMNLDMIQAQYSRSKVLGAMEKVYYDVIEK